MREFIMDIRAVECHWLMTVLTNRGFHALLFYRVSNWLIKVRIPIIPLVLTRMIQILYGIDIDPRAKISGGCRICHGVGLVIGPNVVIGEGAKIFHGVTLGIGFTDSADDGYPTIGNHVSVFAGAKIFGRVKIGNNVKIGANAVVFRDVPDNSTAVGVPAKIISERKKFKVM